MLNLQCSPRCSRRAVLALFLLLPAISWAQTKAGPVNPPTSAEQRAAQAFNAARANPLDLRAFLLRMPKGADLHNHLAGAVYAESRIRAAAEDGLCVNLATLSLLPASVQADEHAKASVPVGVPSQSQNQSGASHVDGASAPTPACADRGVPASQAYVDQHLYDALIDAFSMRDFVPSPAASGHDHFFDAFSKFGAISSSHTGEWLDEVATRAASQSEQYLELMDTPAFDHTAGIAKKIGWRDDLATLRTDMLTQGLRDDVAVARAELDQAEALRRTREHCGRVDAVPSCQVQIRYVYQVLRAAPREIVFAQTLLGFEVASADPRFVGINFVQPEDAQISMTDYDLHMRMVGFLHRLYPHVHISLHAGELAPGMVPPEGLCCHIRLAVEQAHAERIGHGVDALYEDRPYELLKEMASRHVLVEINLTSNDVILGVSGNNHPFSIYRKFGVPVALSTDDEGVSRIDLTHEFVRAVQTYGLHYADVKQLARSSMEHSFLPGVSLWREPDAFGRPVTPCGQSQDAGSVGKPSKSAGVCTQFLASSEKARQQWELERRFREFESSFLAPALPHSPYNRRSRKN
jgi:adenosine deaminase